MFSTDIDVEKMKFSLGQSWDDDPIGQLQMCKEQAFGALCQVILVSLLYSLD